MGEFLEFQDIHKRFGAMMAVDGVSLSIRRGEIFALLGPSGCGKTTLLRMLAGFEQPDQGRILLDGEDLTGLPPNHRKVNTIFQNYALFPHLTVWENIAFGLRVAKRPQAEVTAEVERMLDLIRLREHAHKRPAQLSGGQKQRVAIARALVLKPRVLLLDEPLAALDLKLRQHMLLELDQIHDEVGITFVFVTHDQGEAMSISDRIAVMNQGRIEQIGTPAEVYEAPRSSFVAAFIGDTNFFDGQVTELVDKEYSRLSLPDFPPLLCYNDKQLSVGSEVHLSVRPEKLRIGRERPADVTRLNLVEGQVEDVVYLGSATRFRVQVGSQRVAVVQPHGRWLLDQQPIRWRDKVWLWWHADDGFMLERFNQSDERLASNGVNGANGNGKQA